ncbi:MAG: hypothetical protein ABW193_04495, partial [Luteibacter sp.]
MLPVTRRALCVALFAAVPGSFAAPAEDPVVGQHLADGSGYVSVTPTDEGGGRLLMAFEQKGMAGIATWGSDDGGDH